MNVFPLNSNSDYERIQKKNNISSMLFGNRFKSDQTLYEYLVEFLLIYSSAKNPDLETGKMKFHDSVNNDALSYWVDPRMGLRRFIFFDKSNKKGTIKADEYAYQAMINIIKSKMEEMTDESKNEYIESIQDLFHGYAVVIKNRFWGAQALLPICPEFMMCGCDPTEKKRKVSVKWEDNPISVDTSFAFDKRNFLARGGEIYYLHLLQGLEKHPSKKKILEKLLNDLICIQCEKISKMAAFIQESWEEEMGFDKKSLCKQLKLSFIPEDAYKECEDYSIDEIINFLSCKIPPINRIEILAKGIMFQIMRMMSCCVANYLGIEKRKWIVDMRGESQNTIKKIGAEYYSKLESPTGRLGVQ